MLSRVSSQRWSRQQFMEPRVYGAASQFAENVILAARLSFVPQNCHSEEPKATKNLLSVALQPSPGISEGGGAFRPLSNALNGKRASELAEKPIGGGFVEGHDFSRADKADQIKRALAPAGCFCKHNSRNRYFSAASSAPAKLDLPQRPKFGLFPQALLPRRPYPEPHSCSMHFLKQ